MKNLLLILFLTALGGCGFTPMYQSGGGVMAGLSAIEIAPMEDRLGQQMRGYMVDRIGSESSGIYRLDMKLRKENEGFGIRPDAAATQEQVTLWADYSLVRIADGITVLQDSLRARSSFDVVLSDFATLSQREDTEKRLAFQLADQLQTDLATWLLSQPKD